MQLQLPFQSADSLRDRFEQFHASNPHVYEWLRRQSLVLRRRGRQQYSIKTLLEVLRWQMDLRVASTDGLKINNNHAPYYARMLMEREPELQGFFELRKVSQ